MTQQKEKENDRVWSPLQLAIFQEVRDGTGHLVIQARAGSAKTTTLIEAFEYIPPNKMALFVAFSKDVVKKLETAAPPNVVVSTLHSFGYQALQQWRTPLRIETNRNKADAYLPKSYKWEERRSIIEAVGVAKACLARTREDIDSMLDEFDIPIRFSSRDHFIDRILDTMKQSENDLDTVDFDDMVWLTVLKRVPVRQFQYVFIDELQDLNIAQLLLAMSACKPGGRIIAVGDSKQAIYRWRGADSRAIDNAIESLNAKTLPLSITYRCPKRVVELVKPLVPDFEAAPWAEDGLVEDVSMDDLVDLVRPGDFVLSRFNAPLFGPCLDLLSLGKRAQIAGRDIGSQLGAMVRQSKAETIEDLDAWVWNWLATETERLEKQERSTKNVEDRAQCILAIASQCKDIRALLKKIDELFSDSNDENTVVFSSTHKAKGLERDRVFVLRNTFLTDRTEEEKNLWYVAVTRSKKELYIVS